VLYALICIKQVHHNLLVCPLRCHVMAANAVDPFCADNLLSREQRSLPMERFPDPVPVLQQRTHSKCSHASPPLQISSHQEMHVSCASSWGLLPLNL
jgi:hypothetical protein